MDNKEYNALFSFIWNIAKDVLVHAFEKGDYKKIIMPFMVLRRIDVLLEPTKAAVLEKKKFCDSHNIVDYTPFLTQVTGYPFYNTNSSPSISTSPCSSARSMLSWRTSAA